MVGGYSLVVRAEFPFSVSESMWPWAIIVSGPRLTYHEFCIMIHAYPVDSSRCCRIRCVIICQSSAVADFYPMLVGSIGVFLSHRARMRCSLLDMSFHDSPVHNLVRGLVVCSTGVNVQLTDSPLRVSSYFSSVLRLVKSFHFVLCVVLTT